MFSIIDSEDCFSKHISPYTLKKGDFNTAQPYFKQKENNEPKLKKRRKNPSQTDIQTKERHEKLRPQLISCLDQISEQWPWKDKVENENIDISEKDMIDFASIQQMVESAHVKFDMPTESNEEELIPAQFEFSDSTTKELDIFSLFNICCINKSKKDIKLLELTPTAVYIIPPDSTFLMGSLKSTIVPLGSFVNHIGGADLIVMDPPWPNKSVHRSSHYETQDIYDLFSIPIPKMIKSTGLIAIWVTNKPKFRNFIIHKLFPAWQLECVAEWVWLKLTTQAEPIFPIDSEHKKPYEQLILGRPINHETSVPTIPKFHVIASIPSKKHSRKPPLNDVLANYISIETNPVCVELFARCLTPGCISWGNECLKFQHLNYFETS